MADYIIGDVQGCFDPLERLLDKIQYEPQKDRLWFVGDLVNRGPDSLKTLRFIYQLPIQARIVLGNHDLHLLHCFFNSHAPDHGDTIQDILMAPDADILCHWLRKQPLLYHDLESKIVMCHAGIYPRWSLNDAKRQAKKLEAALQGEEFSTTLAALYGNQPDIWSDSLTTTEELRFICNAFTRMRFCSEQGHLLLGYKGQINQAPSHHYPWFATPHRCIIEEDIVFGHWAALLGQCPTPNIFALDTGCIWGGRLTALRLHDKQRLVVPGV